MFAPLTEAGALRSPHAPFAPSLIREQTRPPVDVRAIEGDELVLFRKVEQAWKTVSACPTGCTRLPPSYWLLVLIRIVAESDSELALLCEASAGCGTAEGHITLVPHVGQEVRFSSGSQTVLGEEAFEKQGETWIEHGGWRLSLPVGSRVVWPARPHNPYRKAGDATVKESRIVVVLPFSATTPRHHLTLQVHAHP